MTTRVPQGMLAFLLLKYYTQELVHTVGTGHVLKHRHHADIIQARLPGLLLHLTASRVSSLFKAALLSASQGPREVPSSALSSGSTSPAMSPASSCAVLLRSHHVVWVLLLLLLLQDPGERGAQGGHCSCSFPRIAGLYGRQDNGSCTVHASKQYSAS